MQSLINAACTDLSTLDRDNLADIRDVKIDTSLPVKERINSYIRQIKNPYLYKCGDIVVRVSFADTDATLEDRIKQYLLTSRAM